MANSDDTFRKSPEPKRLQVAMPSRHQYNGKWNISSLFDLEVNGEKIKYKDIFEIKLEASGNSIKLSCGQLYSMVGKSIKLAAKDENGENSAEIIAEVIS